MDDQLDNDLKNRIREVFDNYEDASADEGWALLREKHPEKERRRAAAWIWWAAAAVVLLCLGILWFERPSSGDQQMAGVKKQPGNAVVKNLQPETTHTAVKTDTASQKHVDEHAIANNASASIQKTTAAAKTLAKPSEDGSIAKTSERPTTVSANKPDGIKPAATTNSEQVLASSGRENAVNKDVAVNNKPGQTTIQNQNPIVPGKDVIATVQPKNPGNNTSAKISVDTVGRAIGRSPVATITTPSKTGVDMQAEAAKNHPQTYVANNERTSQKAEKPMTNNKLIRFGVYAATYFNYAKGSNNQLNIGAGLSSDIALTKNLKLSTGVSITQNTMTYALQPPQNTQKNFIAVTSFAASATQYTASVPTFKNYNANLVGLDVPINLKFMVNPDKGDTYISAGLSSGTFINESYVYSYNNPAPFSSNVSQVQDQSTHQSFNGFYFAKMLNVSFGTGIPIGANRVVIEPFLKYPLDGLGSQQLKFGAGGLNLKFNFATQKKK